jgi:hypothetical protein
MAFLFDDLVGGGKQIGRHDQAMLAVVEDDENAMILDGDGDLIDWILLEADFEPQSRSTGRRRLCLILDRGRSTKATASKAARR